MFTRSITRLTFALVIVGASLLTIAAFMTTPTDVCVEAVRHLNAPS